MLEPRISVLTAASLLSYLIVSPLFFQRKLVCHFWNSTSVSYYLCALMFPAAVVSCSLTLDATTPCLESERTDHPIKYYYGSPFHCLDCHPNSWVSEAHFLSFVAKRKLRCHLFFLCWKLLQLNEINKFKMGFHWLLRLGHIAGT